MSYRNTRVERIYGREELAETLGSHFKAVLGNAHKKTGMRAVVLIDEYDKQLFFSVFMHILAEK
ncbi:AAA family ATPase [Segatella copri]|uniref:AAA family ATPase n=1 Tax=Segatella copri TaxID=165179 RepID=UPI0029165EE5|nr:AAA family ATPase [Segatella copri]MDV3121666.1 AAA family ATPase [Segatella copri]